MDNTGKMPAGDRRLFYSLAPAAVISMGILVVMTVLFIYYSIPAVRVYGTKLITTSTWSPSEYGEPSYGLLIPILGTLISSIIAVVIALPLALSAVFFTEEVLPRSMDSVRSAFASLIEAMTGIPTIVYGLWGLMVLSPFLRDNVYQPLYRYLGFIPLFSCEPVTGSTILTAGILLSIMITPFIYAVVRQSYNQVPRTYKEAILALGATRYEYARILFGMIKPAILAGALIGFGRAAGETVAVALVVGNTFNPPTCILSPSYTVSALIANQFANAPLYPYMVNVLVLGGLILLVLGIISNILGVMYLARVRYVA